MDEVRTMDFQKYKEYLEENPNHHEIGKYDDFEVAVEKSIEVSEIPEKLGLPSDSTTKVIKMVTEQYGLWGNEMVDDGYVVVVVRYE